MKNYKVLLYDEEETFVLALMNYVNRNSQIPILIMAFTELEGVKDFLCVHRPDLIVSGRKENVDALIAETAIPVLWIVEEWNKENEIGKEAPVIAKYSPASVYVRKMLQLLSKVAQYKYHEKDSICVAIYSPVGRCGTTTFAHELCKRYSVDDRTGKNCIYLGWEEFAMEADENRRMEELLYYIKQRTDNLSVKMKALAVEADGYSQIPCAASYQELRELNQEDLQWMLQAIHTEGYYDALVADIGSGCLSDLELLTEFDVVYLPYLQEVHAERKKEQFIQTMRRQDDWHDFSEKCYPVAIPSAGISQELVQRLEESRKNGDLQSIKQVVT